MGTKNSTGGGGAPIPTEISQQLSLIKQLQDAIRLLDKEIENAKNDKSAATIRTQMDRRQRELFDIQANINRLLHLTQAQEVLIADLTKLLSVPRGPVEPITHHKEELVCHICTRPIATKPVSVCTQRELFHLAAQ